MTGQTEELEVLVLGENESLDKVTADLSPG